jgi:hypothetical protein
LIEEMDAAAIEVLGDRSGVLSFRNILLSLSDKPNNAVLGLSCITRLILGLGELTSEDAEDEGRILCERKSSLPPRVEG